MGTFTSWLRSPDGGAQMRLYTNTSSPSDNQSVTVEPSIASVCYRPGIDEKESSEYSSTKEEAHANSSVSEEKALDKPKLDNLENCLALSALFHKPAYRSSSQ